MKASNGCKAKGMSGPCDNGENGMGLNENKFISTKIDKNISIMYMYIFALEVSLKIISGSI